MKTATQKLPITVTTTTDCNVDRHAETSAAYVALRERVGVESWRYTLSAFERQNGKFVCWFNRVR